MDRFVFVISVLVFPLIAGAQEGDPAITADDLRAHVRYLASDQLEGRASGTEGNRKAAAYIAGKFAAWGLAPLGSGGGYLQPFEIVTGVAMGPANALAFGLPAGGKRTAVPDRDFRPLGFSADSSVSGGVVFAGYGITAAELNYDDYAGIDAAGKIVIVLRHSPDGTDPHGELSPFASLRNKTRTAREHGAAALIVVNGPADEPEDSLIRLTYDQSFATSGLPAVAMKRSILTDLLAGRDLAPMEDSIRKSRKPLSFPIDGCSASLTAEVSKLRSTTANVVGYLEGSDPARRGEAIVVGAHLDHLGYGGPGSGSMQPDKLEIHNGADDNASGTAGLLEIAQACAANRGRFPRSLVFVAFSGEEMGTLGSGYYVNNPPIPLASTIAMLNMDMIGRMEENSLTVHGTGTAEVWADLLKRLNTGPDSVDRMTMKMVADGFGPSDHSQFYGKEIPVLFFYTGAHEDYHKPSDDWDKLHYPDHQRVTQLVYDVAVGVAGLADRPAFRKTSSPMAGGGGGRGFSVSLGVIPDYAWTGEGLRIDGVRTDGPAEKAGMQGGDVVVSLAGKKVLNIYDYMGILGELKAGQQVTVEYLRGGERLTTTATMVRRQ